MARVLLTHSNQVASDPKQAAKMQPYPPLQTILAAAVLRREGSMLFCSTQRCLPIRIRDFGTRSSGIGPIWWWFAKTISTSSPRCVSRVIANCAFRMAGTAAAAGIPVAAHGSDASDHPPSILKQASVRSLSAKPEDALLELVQQRQRAAIGAWRMAKRAATPL